MLGRGRPFILEVQDPKYLEALFPAAAEAADSAESLLSSLPLPLPSPSLFNFLPKLEESINLRSGFNSRGDVEVDGGSLRHVARSVYDEVLAGAEEKTKTYACLVWCSEPLAPEDLARSLGSLVDLSVSQETPLRVLHRRTPLVRPKTIHAMRPLWISPHWFSLELTASAGTYVKEFVHGDLGRTSPSVADLLAAGLEKRSAAAAAAAAATGAGADAAGADAAGVDAAGADAPATIAAAAEAGAAPLKRLLKTDILQLDVANVHTTGVLA